MEPNPAQTETPCPKLPNVLPEVAYRPLPDGRPLINQSGYQVQEPPLANPVVGGVAPSPACPTAARRRGLSEAPHLPMPNEKAKTMLPAYVIEPPDVLTIDGIRLIPRPPYRIEPLDVLLISVPEALPDQPIAGPYTVTPEGTVYLGTGYGAFRVSGLTLEQAAAAIKAGLRLNNPQVSVALGQFRGVQQVRGDHIVGQDGTITLGTFGCVNVTGLTLSQAKCEIERHLSRWLLDPIISVSVSGYNSKVYYVITDGGGFGQQVYRLPITGNETVLDAISMINGLPAVSSKRHIWLAGRRRPRRLLRDPAGQLGGDHRGRLDGDQLADLPRRPRLRQSGPLHHLRQPAFQGALADRTPARRHAARHQHRPELPQQQQSTTTTALASNGFVLPIDPEHPAARERAECSGSRRFIGFAGRDGRYSCAAGTARREGRRDLI